MSAYDLLIPSQISVQPVFFIPKGQSQPTEKQKNDFLRHLKWTHKKYLELLGGRDTFILNKDSFLLINGKYSLSHYRKLPERAALQFSSEILEQTGFNRFNCPYIFTVMVVNSEDHFPAGSGRPFNGGINTGGGVMIMSTGTLDRSPLTQSTLEHELGHAFGLPHVDVYGYDMGSNDSLMSYNLDHHTNYFKESKKRSILIPEDIRALKLNRRVFKKLSANTKSEVPPGYKIFPRIIWLGPMDLSGQIPYDIKVTTKFGEAYGSKVSNVVFGGIYPSAGPGITYDAITMWHTGPVGSGWVYINLEFPVEVTLDSIVVHSQHSGKYHEAKSVKIEIENNGRFKAVLEKRNISIDETVAFKEVTSKKWRLHFLPGPTRHITIRGIQFFLKDNEIFPPWIPYSTIKTTN